MEEINRRIATQLKLLDFAEKETKRLLTRNKKKEIEKHLQQLQQFKYPAQDILLDEGEMENREWSSVTEEKLAHFDDVADRLKSAISNVEKKEEAKTTHEENIILEEMFRKRMQEELKIQELKLQMKSKEYENR